MPPIELPDFNIRIIGADLPYAARTDIRSVTVQEDLDALSMFTLELYNWDDEQLRVSWSDSPLFSVGKEVEIWLGYLGDLHKVMLAEITSLEPTFSADQPPTLIVRGYDYRHRLARGRKTRTFTKMKDSAIASQVALEAGLRAQTQDTKVSLPHVVQSNQTDLEFLRKRARLIGYEVYVREKVLYFQPPQTTESAAIELSIGGDLIEFAPRLSALGQVSEVAVRGWDVKHKQEIVGKVGAGDGHAMMGASFGPNTAQRAFGRASVSSVRQPVQSRAEADQIALGRYNDMAMTFIQGDATCEGRPQLRAGAVVDIAGAGKTFSGPYYITSVTHTLTQEAGYQTQLTVQRNATGWTSFRS
jgi:phage protein D